jgi:hypothetical protein
MELTRLLKLMMLMTVAGLVAVGCLARGNTVNMPEVDEYEQALQRFAGTPEGIERGVENFAESYRDLTCEDLEARMTALYAETLFFNDTLHSFHRRQDLVDYLTKTGSALKQSDVEIRQVLRDGPDVFVRWSMDFRTRVAGRDIHSRSIGVTHLRFDAEGRIVLHQDFWDSGHALYAHLPIVGFAVRRAREQM